MTKLHSQTSPTLNVLPDINVFRLGGKSLRVSYTWVTVAPVLTSRQKDFFVGDLEGQNRQLLAILDRRLRSQPFRSFDNVTYRTVELRIANRAFRIAVQIARVFGATNRKFLIASVDLDRAISPILGWGVISRKRLKRMTDFS